VSKNPGERYTVAVDFDGVIHRYDSPWIAPHVIPDPPVPGAISWLFEMAQRFSVVIYSTRARTWRGRRAMRRWLKVYGEACWFETMGHRGLEEVRFSYEKPKALIYLDDRAVRFEGTFPTAEQIHAARPWNKPRKGAPV
jgi:hypothetical protein